MSLESTTVRVADNGRLSLPTKQRRMIGLENGGMVVVTVEEGEIRIKPVRTVVEHLQNGLSAYFTNKRNNVEEFIAERKTEYIKETKED